MSNLVHLESALHSVGIVMTSKIKRSVAARLACMPNANKHFCFIASNGNIVCYDTNTFMQTTSFPFSRHAEVNAVCKLYSTRKINRVNKIVLVVVKLSTTGVIGNSRCCTHCANFLFNNYDNLNLKAIHYSMPTEMITLKKTDLETGDFNVSSGYARR